MVFRETLRPLSSCCFLHLNLSITPLSHTNTCLYLSFQLLCNHHLYSTAHPISHPLLFSTPIVLFYFSLPTSSSTLCARRPGQIQLAPWKPSKPCIAGMMYMLKDGVRGRVGGIVCAEQEGRGGGYMFFLSAKTLKFLVALKKHLLLRAQHTSE
ncbi:hypothetical protein AMECASPLE_001536 [Ameca splendens]|uniref:Uncharacterized protein n=1 Tax=Ameca splendens TaxID=208324 RepID=A0ABV0X9Y0_9TELE